MRVYKMLHLLFLRCTGGSSAATIASSKTFLSCSAVQTIYNQPTRLGKTRLSQRALTPR